MNARWIGTALWISTTLLVFAGCAMTTSNGPADGAVRPGMAASHEGRPITLNPDGTWRYADGPVNIPSFTKSESASASVKGKAGFYTLWFDETKWTTSDTRLNKDTEFEFVHKEGDRFVWVVAERLEIPRSAVRNVVLKNIKSKTPDMRVTLDEIRRGNGAEVLCLEWETVVEGMPMTFIMYVWSGRKGTVQVGGLTGRNLFDEFRSDFTELLNGLVVLTTERS
jgi:hypothetical protein